MLLINLFKYSLLFYAYKKKNSFRNIKARFNLNGLVEVHHIIPRQFKGHPTIRESKYDIENTYNLMFLPTYKGKSKLNLNENRPIHEGGHIKYNYYIKYILNELDNNNLKDEESMCILNKNLRSNLKNITYVPWK